MTVNLQVKWLVLPCQLFASILIKEMLHEGHGGTQAL